MRGLRDLLQFLLKLLTFAALVAAVLRFFFVDIVLCEHPRRPEASVIGRALAFSGHTVSTDERGQLFVDGNRAVVEGAGKVRFYDVLREKMFTMKLASIEYHGKHRHDFFVEEGRSFSLPTFPVETGMYLLGDNRMDSDNDSREFGEVDPATCRGEIFMRLTPAAPQEDDIKHGYFDFIH